MSRSLGNSAHVPMAPNPCTDWHDWERFPNVHIAFHYWLWDTSNEPQSEERLGQRIYIASCLLWSALHDRYIGRLLKERHPNWSAVSNYYSMVHALRLFWFLLYGSYPTRHADMGHGFDPNARSGARPDWFESQMRGRMPSTQRPSIKFTAFEELLKVALRIPNLAERLSDVGHVFSTAKELRNDSNYESLILAHQYHHTPEAGGDGEQLFGEGTFALQGSFGPSSDRRNVQELFDAATEAFDKADTMVVNFVCECLKAAFDDQVNWIGRGSRFSGSDLLRLLLGYVRKKIDKAHQRFLQQASHNWATSQSASFRLDQIDSWWSELVLPLADPAFQEIAGLGEVQRLVRYAQFPRFDMKRQFMGEFSRKVSDFRRFG